MAKKSVPAARSSLRQLWQVPAFLLGVAALGAFLVVRPAWNNPDARAAARLDQARRLWSLSDPRVAKTIELAEQYLDHAGPAGARAGEAHLIWGSSLARLARKSAADEAPARWREAHQHLDQAQQLGVSEEDGPALRVVLGEAGFHTGDDLARVCGLLRRNLDAADDRAAVCRLLALASLKKQPPDLEAALAANEMLRQLPLINEDVLGPARVQGGEILLRLRRPAEARKLLEKVARDAGPVLVTRARALRARSHQNEAQWGEACALWQELLADPRHPPADVGEALYELGVCHRRLDQREEAIRAWRESVQRGRGDSVAASSLGLAELLLAEAPAEAAAALARAVKDVRTAADWKNQHVTLRQACEVFERACQALREKREYGKALEVVRSYERLAAAGMAAYARGQALRDWGRALRQARPAEQKSAADLLRQAGEAFETSAAAAAQPAEQAEQLWLSAEGHFEGGDSIRAVAVLERFLKLSGHTPERNGEAWYLLGQAHEALNNRPAVEAAYARCLSFRSRFAYRARYRLSQAELGRGNTDKAAEMLELNLQMLRVDPDDEALEQTLFTLARLQFRRRDYAAVRLMLEMALDKFPSSRLATRGRFELAETYRQLAQENQLLAQDINLKPEAREHFLQQRRDSLGKAIEQYETLGQSLGEEAGGAFTPREQVQILFSVADCRFNLGEYPVALQLYDGLADRYKDRLERLSALGGTARCYAAQRDFTRFKARLDEIRVALRGVDEPTRRQWEEWLSVAGK